MRFALLAFVFGLHLMDPSSAAAAKRCPVKVKKACVYAKLDGPKALKPLMKLGLKGGKPKAKTEKLAQRMLDLRVGKTARIASSDDPVFGREVSVTGDTDGPQTAVYERADGVRATLNIDNAGSAVIELRDRKGAGHTLGLTKADVVPDCPRANGDVPATYDHSFTFGQATAEHGKRTWTLATVRVEVTWTGHVGVGAKAETFDFALRGELSIKSGVEIASTGKVLKRMPTKTYRAALTKRGVRVGADPLPFAKDFTLRGPKGNRASEEDIQPVTGLLTTAMMGISDLSDALLKGDKRWYDAMMCASLDIASSPEKVVKGGQGDFDVRALAQDGTPVADARWTVTSGCGTVQAPASGPAVHITVTDPARAWIPSSQGACAHAEVTTTAGRPVPLNRSIPPVEAKRWRYDFKVTFNKTMGPGIAETNAVGAAGVTIGPEDGLVEGTGTYAGTEWDQTVFNTCGQDMARARGFSSPATFGGEIQGDEVTLGFTANERPFEAAWIVTLPVTGGTRTITARQPFCGEPQKALTTAVIAVSATPVG
ncbi:hypothetical protein [Solirubrobacter soli]|uniref:hypothetical protein n=1 Tax=Solirubrobacter soli TaxID=363832 RepID=UPI00041F379A|nr:hypothetical protein [Solirubrobacter soli]